jgi:hypothetical protein
LRAEREEVCRPTEPSAPQARPGTEAGLFAGGMGESSGLPRQLDARILQKTDPVQSKA